MSGFSALQLTLALALALSQQFCFADSKKRMWAVFARFRTLEELGGSLLLLRGLGQIESERHV